MPSKCFAHATALSREFGGGGNHTFKLLGSGNGIQFTLRPFCVYFQITSNDHWKSLRLLHQSFSKQIDHLMRRAAQQLCAPIFLRFPKSFGENSLRRDADE